MSQTTPNWTPADEAALKHAWDWFSLHAAQRMQVVSFLFLGLALIVAGYGAAFQADSYKIAGALAVAGVVICGGFYLLEERTRQLCKACESALEALELELSARNTAGANVTFVPAVEAPTTPFKASYSSVIRHFISSAALLMAVGAVYAFCADEPKPLTGTCSGTLDSKGTESSQHKKVTSRTNRADKSGFAVTCTTNKP